MADKSSESKQERDGSQQLELSNDKLRELIRMLELQSRGPEQSKLEREEEEERKKVHEFWNTQPVPKSAEVVSKDGEMHAALKPSEIRAEPYELSEELEWCTLDVASSSVHVQELHDLLLEHYVEDADSSFRFNYSAEFLRWALLPPGAQSEWHVGVRRKSDQVLVAFISGIPVDMMVRDRTMRMAEINFLCLHKGLRSQRLAPLLIKEVTRRVHLVGIFQAVYTVGRLLPKPVATCRYFHRPLNPRKLMDTGFSQRLEGAALSRLLSSLKLPAAPQINGLREMRKGDVAQVRKLMNRHLKSRYEILPVFSTDAEVAHWLLPRAGVVWTYVVEDAQRPGRVTDFVSFYSLPSSVLKAGAASGRSGKGVRKPPGVATNAQYTAVNAAYLFYYGTQTDYDVQLTEEEKATVGATKKQEKALIKEKQRELLGARLRELVGDALIMAARQGSFDVFNCLEMMDNGLFLDALNFGPGDGYLRYYFFNYMARHVDSNKVGFVML
ncbi:glycylpeptide N-tetradecanoyltransferase [Coemansia sp. Benny D115]|nr:glycylpeptide N-tetradecanoyltransferase [Coemansia sp. Benny D115]